MSAALRNADTDHGGWSATTMALYCEKTTEMQSSLPLEAAVGSELDVARV